MENDSKLQKRLLVVGAGGFIGGFIAAEALKRGYDTYVAVRESTSRRYLTDKRLKFVVLDYDNEDSLVPALKNALPEGEKWQYIVYNLGATKCVNFTDFNRINYLYLSNFIEALREADLMPSERFLYMSSLSALGIGDEKNYAPLTSQTIPQPNTRYGVSKIKAETFIETCSDLPWVIFRPTGVYGPHEKDYLMMIQSIDSHFDFGVGYRRQMLTFVYVEDLVGAIFDAIASEKTLKKKYIISEPRAYSQKEFRKIVAKHLGNKWVIPVRLPLWMAYVASVVAEKWGTFKGSPSTLNRDKFIIMKQRNWNCDVSDAVKDFNFTSRFPLDEGVRLTVEAYLNGKNNNKEKQK